MTKHLYFQNKYHEIDLYAVACAFDMSKCKAISVHAYADFKHEEQYISESVPRYDAENYRLFLQNKADGGMQAFTDCKEYDPADYLCAVSNKVTLLFFASSSSCVA